MKTNEIIQHYKELTESQQKLIDDLRSELQDSNHRFFMVESKLERILGELSKNGTLSPISVESVSQLKENKQK